MIEQLFACKIIVSISKSAKIEMSFFCIYEHFTVVNIIDPFGTSLPLHFALMTYMDRTVYIGRSIYISHYTILCGSSCPYLISVDFCISVKDVTGVFNKAVNSLRN